MGKKNCYFDIVLNTQFKRGSRFFNEWFSEYKRNGMILSDVARELIAQDIVDALQLSGKRAKRVFLLSDAKLYKSFVEIIKKYRKEKNFLSRFYALVVKDYFSRHELPWEGLNGSEMCAMLICTRFEHIDAVVDIGRLLRTAIDEGLTTEEELGDPYALWLKLRQNILKEVRTQNVF
jgi:hypothetical protein